MTLRPPTPASSEEVQAGTRLALPPERAAAEAPPHGAQIVFQRGADREPRTSKTQHCRWWVIPLGVALIPPNCLWIARTEALDYSGFPTNASLFYNVIFSLIVLILLNGLVRRLAPRHALNRGELLVVYGMVATGSSLVGHDFLEILVPTIPHAAYFATPENAWATRILPHLPDWLTINARTDAVVAYERGRSTLYTAQHLRLWLVPVAAWSVFLLALVASMLSINVLLRRQWVDNERLAYPIVQIPLLLTENGGASPLFGRRLFWLGFALAAGLDLYLGLAYWFPILPSFNLKLTDVAAHFNAEYPWKVVDRFYISFYPFVIGLSFFMPTNMAFSSWFFFLFRKAEQVGAAALGYYKPGDLWYPYVREQAYGAWLALFIVSLFLARGYLKQIGRAALTGCGQTEDGGVSYRLALIVLALGMATMAGFLIVAGMTPSIAIVYVLLYLLLVGAITRMRAELGPPAHEVALVSTSHMIVLGLGTVAVGPQNLALFSLLWFQNRTYRGLLMPQQAESLKAASESGLRIRTMVIALAIAGVVGIGAAFWAHLHLAYGRLYHGGHPGAPGSGFAGEHYGQLMSWLSYPVPPNQMGLFSIGLGAAIALILARLTVTYFGFPFHPAGFALGMAFGLDYVWLPICISWCLKVLILRYQGLSGYRAAIPFFVGLVLGEFTVGGLWSFARGIIGVETYTFFY